MSKSPQQISFWWLAVPVVFLILAILALSPSPRPGLHSGQDSPAIGKPAPQLDLVPLSRQQTLDPVDEISNGEVTLIHFWGTWCGPCKLEYPKLSLMVNRLQPHPRFRFVPVSCEGGGHETFDGLRAKTEQYFQSEGIESFALADPQGITRRSAAERLERSSMFYPTSILIGLDGKIAGVWEGYTAESVDQIASLIDRLLEQSADQI